MNTFDNNGDLWIEVEANWNWPNDSGVHEEALTPSPRSDDGTYFTVAKMNLTQYIRNLISKAEVRL